jgi:hypothetical protein
MNLLDLAISIQEEVAASQSNTEGPTDASPQGLPEAARRQALDLREIREMIRQAAAPKDDAARPSRLASPFPLCRYVMPSGLRCRSARLRGSHLFCYFHNRTCDRRVERQQSGERGAGLRNIPELEDRAAVRIALEEVVRACITDEISERKAGVLFYGLQLAMQATPDAKQPVAQQVETNVVEDEELGEYVPLSEDEQREQAQLREQLSNG